MATISGSADNDVLSGSGPGTIEGLGGADRITFSTFGYALGDEVLLDGGSGNDFISSFVTNTSGGAVPTGTMTVLGGDGDDTILTMGAIGRSVDAGAGNDLVLIGVGGTPTDHFVTGATGSVITLGAGADTLSINSLNYTGAPSIVTDFDPAQDRIVLNDVAVFGSGVPELKVGNAFVNGYLRLVKSGADTKLQVDRDGGGNGFVDAIVFRNIAPAAFTDVAGFNVAGGGTRGYVVNATSAGIFTFGDRIQVVTRGGAGNDTITGTAFMDFLSGERGDDVLNGGSGDDVLTDDFGKNVLKGGSGNDQITSHGIDDQQFGGAGNDTLAYSAISRTSLGGVQARLDGGDGDDRLTIDSTLVTTRLIGGSGNDTIEIVFGLVGDSVISGGTGDDQITVTNGFSTLLLGSGSDSVTITRDLSTPANQHVTLVDFVPGTDTVGFAFSTYLGAWDGESNPFDSGFLKMRQDGRDAVLLLDANGGADGAIEFIRFQTTSVKSLTPPDTAGFAFDRAEFIGTALTDRYSGLTGNDTMLGNDGADALSGLGGSDMLDGGAGDDLLRGGTGSDKLYGRSGADTLDGGGGTDTLAGNDGDDILQGGSSKDTLSGGTGADRFVFGLADSAADHTRSDRISDFRHSQGDRLDLSAIDADSTLAGDQAFAFIGTAAFGKVAGQLHLVADGGNTYVEGDINADGVADFAIRLDGAVTLVAGDFVL